MQWDARFDQVLLVKQSFPTALQVAILQADFRSNRRQGVTRRFFTLGRQLTTVDGEWYSNARAHGVSLLGLGYRLCITELVPHSASRVLERARRHCCELCP